MSFSHFEIQHMYDLITYCVRDGYYWWIRG